MDDMSEYQKLYAIESAEHLQSMNNALLCLEKDAHDIETINVMFRAAHTLKGMSATMGYINISELTHKMENLMDKVRKNEMILDQDSIDLLFQCLDSLEIMVDAPENSAQCDISRLVQKIQSIVESCTGTNGEQSVAQVQQSQETDANNAVNKSDSNTYDVKVTLDNSCTLTGARSTVIIRDLSEIGEVIDSVLPSGDSEEGKGAKELRVKVSAKAEAKKIESIIKNINEVSGVEVKPCAAKSTEKRLQAQIPPSEINGVANITGTGRNNFNVTVTFDKTCTLKVARSTLVMRNLSEMGEIIDTTPPARDIGMGKFVRGFTVKISTDSDAKKIESVIKKVNEVTNVEVKPAEAQPAAKHAADPQQTVKSAADVQPASKPASDVQQAMKPAAEAQLNKEKIIEKERAAVKNIQSVRVSVDRLDSLMNLVGELVINKIRIVQLASDYKIDALEEALTSLDHLTAQLQEEIMASRMVPLEQIFNRFPRMIRDLAKIENKKIELIVAGGDIELDRTILDEIGDPLVHILRNCVDHGIELPQIRKQNGKNQAGIIKLTARREKNYVSIEIEDDGKGMDPAKFREIAIKKGFMTKEDVAKLSDTEALNLSYLPGFTSAEKVTEISGRGVGLDVVKTRIESMGGSVRLDSKCGAWTRINLKLPLTVAIINSQMVRVGKNIYAIPIANIVRDIIVRKDQIKTIKSEEVVLIREEVLPLIRLQKLFGIDSNGSKELIVVVVERMGSNIGLVVDQLIGQQEVIIKNIDNRVLKGLKGFAGATILGDGNVALIIDVGTLL